jgi:hypothetical protein
MEIVTIPNALFALSEAFFSIYLCASRNSTFSLPSGHFVRKEPSHQIHHSSLHIPPNTPSAIGSSQLRRKNPTAKIATLLQLVGKSFRPDFQFSITTQSSESCTPDCPSSKPQKTLEPVSYTSLSPTPSPTENISYPIYPINPETPME